MNNKCECALCQNNLPFQMPMEIIESLLSGDLIVFAGAGISTETKTVFKETLYEDILFQLNLNEDISFPDLMSKFCDTKKNGRQKLLGAIKRRFDYCHQFKELYHSASTFHRQIAPLWMLQNIITTNWDDYFERECDAIPIVTPQDFAFYNLNERKVFKIHGSISNYGSIVATNEDYHKCYEELNKGLIGANLKTLLATKTVLFVGYSFRDFDFQKIMDYLKSEMKDVFPHIYIITLDEEAPENLKEIDKTIIRTNGSFFFEKVKEHLEGSKIILPEESIDRAYDIKYLIRESHKLLSKLYFEERRTNSLIYCLMYQDGIQHALDYIEYKSKSGSSYNPDALFHQIYIYEEEIKKDLYKAKNYMDIAYVQGYIEGLKIPLLFEEENIDDFPKYFLFGKGGPTNNAELVFKTFRENIIHHKTSEKYGNKYFSNFLDLKNEIIPDHRPFIF